MRSMDAVVKAQNLVVSYGKHVALRLDDFRIGTEAGVVGLLVRTEPVKARCFARLWGILLVFRGESWLLIV